LNPVLALPTKSLDHNAQGEPELRSKALTAFLVQLKPNELAHSSYLWKYLVTFILNTP
jgi:hypothetical protein